MSHAEFHVAMQTGRKAKSSSQASSPEQISAAKTAAAPVEPSERIDWSKATVTTGGGVAATIGGLRRARGKNKKPTKEQVAIRFDADVLAAFRAGGPGWQTRINEALKEWLGMQRPESQRR